MSINFNHTAQSLKFFYEVKDNLYNKASLRANEDKLIRPLALGLAIASGALTLAARVSHVGETFFKGFANLFGAMFSERYSFLKGAKQIYAQLPISLLSLVLSPIQIAASEGLTTMSVLVAPKSYLGAKTWGFETKIHLLEERLEEYFIPETDEEKQFALRYC